MPNTTAEWQNAFSTYATNVAFSVQLSRVQVKAIHAIANDTWAGQFNMFFATAHALQRRGLCEHNPRPHPKKSWIYRLTPAGELVHQLLILSGAIQIDAEEQKAA